MQVIYVPKAADFVVNLDDSLGVRVRRVISLLEARGNSLRMPFSKPVENGIFELRIVGALHIRLLFFFCKGDAVVAHAFFKKTERLSRRDIEYALLVQKVFIADI
ncbi:MAG: type II toxin-antitoxin system RelE/ParE family toxin [Candidatus Kaiserbacteria bacterium]|nr:type II toxin-antitoxin system RelE/ParE family toxin [Candidatus Kaiserbacteria bacterium]